MDKRKDKKLKQEAPKTEATNWEDVAKRALADLDNYKKQQEKLRGEMTQFMSLALMHKFLSVYDDLARVLETVKKEEVNAGVTEGMENILKKFGDVFKNEGLEQINVSPKDKFDPATMEAISHEEHAEIKDDCVIEQFEGGLMYKDKVIKPSKVRVSKGVNNG